MIYTSQIARCSIWRFDKRFSYGRWQSWNVIFLVEMHLLIFFFFFFAKENVINSIMFGNKFRYILLF